MKERMFDLTARPTPSTLEVKGDIFMAGESGGGENLIREQPKVFKEKPLDMRVRIEEQGFEKLLKTKRDWDKFNAKFNAGKELSIDERRVQEEAIRMGVSPDLTEDAKRILHGYDQRKMEPNQVGEKMKQTLMANGVSEEDINSKSFDELMGILREKDLSDVELPTAAGGQGGEPPEEPPTAEATLGGDSEDDSEEEQFLRERGMSKEGIEYLMTKKGLMLSPEIIAVLSSENPDFNKIPQLEEFIKKYLDPADGEHRFEDFARDILSNNNYSKSSKEIVLERMFEQILSMADETPDTPYHTYSGNLYVSTNLQKLLQIARASLPEKFAYFGNLAHIREVAHELNRNLKYGEQYKKYVTESLRSHGLNFMHNELAGVRAVVREYERICSAKVRESGNWFSDREVKEIDREVKEILKSEGSEIKSEDGRLLTEWEINRAILIGKVLFAGTQRMAMYSAIGDLPHETMTTGRIGSRPFEYIARSLFPFKMAAPRYFAPAGGSKRYMERVYEEQKEQFKEDGIELYPIFGLDERTIMMDGYGALDTQTHGWRSELMFLGAVRIEVDGHKLNLLDYLNDYALKYGGNPKDPILGGKGVESKDAFSEDVKEVVLGQRLYLSYLARYGNFDSELKADIWKKISLLTPSTIASIVPTAVGETDKDTWEKMKHKLYVAENRRIDKDLHSYEGELSNSKMTDESLAYTSVVEIVEKNSWSDSDYASILDYMGMSDVELDLNEKRLLQKIVKTGFSESGRLAKANLPFAFAVVDAPYVAWSKTKDGSGGLEDEDIFRLLLSDQDALTKAYGEMTGLVENPSVGIREHVKAAVEGIGAVTGRNPAQKKIRPFILAWTKMASTYGISEWIGDFQQLARKATSEMTKYFRNSHISYDSKAREALLEGMAQDGSISDDISGGKSDLDMIKKKTRSNGMANLKRMMRLIIILLGPEAGAAFLKTILPGDLVKSLERH